MGNGVIGVVKCDQFMPINNKQDFDDGPTNKKIERWVKDQLEEYFYRIINKEEQLDSEHETLEVGN